MKTTLAVIGDPHGEWEALDRVARRLAGESVDGALVVGDFFGRMCLTDAFDDAALADLQADTQRTLDILSASVSPILWVPGNHDHRALQGEGNIDGRCDEIAGLRIAGIGGAGPNHFGFPYEWDEDDVRALQLPPCDILLSHTPPADTPLDLTAWGDRHVGSVAVRERAEAHDGVLVCGHIHEAAGAVQLGRCLCLNAGALGHPFGRPQLACVTRDEALPGGWEVSHVDLESGEVRRWRRSRVTP